MSMGCEILFKITFQSEVISSNKIITDILLNYIWLYSFILVSKWHDVNVHLLKDTWLQTYTLIKITIFVYR